MAKSQLPATATLSSAGAEAPRKTMKVVDSSGHSSRVENLGTLSSSRSSSSSSLDSLNLNIVSLPADDKFRSISSAFGHTDRPFRKEVSSWASSRTPRDRGWADRDNIAKRIIPPDPKTSPAVTNEMILEVSEMCNKPACEYIHEKQKFKLALKVSELKNYDGTSWLDDSNINFYLEMIKERNHEEGSKLPSVYVFHCSFYQLFNSDHDYYMYDLVTSTTEPEDIFSFQRILIPINSHFHWRLICVDTDRKTICAFDSMRKDNQASLMAILYYLKKEYSKLRQREFTSEGENRVYRKTVEDFFVDWTLLNYDAAPAQRNFSDCGVFILQFADYIAREQRFDFAQKNMPYFRQRMAYETIKGRLLPQKIPLPD